MALFPTTIEGFETTPTLRFWGKAPPRALVGVTYVKNGKDWTLAAFTKARIIRGGKWEIKVDPAAVPPPGTYPFTARAHRLLIFEVGKSAPVTVTV